MGKRKVSILEPATAVAEIAWFIESKGYPETAKQFVNDAFLFFRNSLMKDLNISHAIITNGNILNIAALIIKRNISLHI